MRVTNWRELDVRFERAAGIHLLGEQVVENGHRMLLYHDARLRKGRERGTGSLLHGCVRRDEEVTDTRALEHVRDSDVRVARREQEERKARLDYSDDSAVVSDSVWASAGENAARADQRG